MKDKKNKISLSELKKLATKKPVTSIKYDYTPAPKKDKKKPEIMSKKVTKKQGYNKIKLDSKKCRMFIQNLSDAERYYCGHVIDIVLALRQLIGEERDGKMGVSEFCDHFKIQAKQYIKFIGGDYGYGLIDTVRITLAQEIVAKRKNNKLR